MRVPFLVACLLAATLAGCAAPEPVSSEATLSTAAGEAKRAIRDPVFLGMAGIEGTIDLDRLEAFVKEEADEEGMGEEADDFFEAFDLKVPQGEIGDGLPGSWFHAYTNQTWATLLVVQVGSTGVLGSYEWSEEDYEEDEVEPMRTMPLLGDFLATSPTVSVSASSSMAYSCNTESTVAWTIDSVRATELARAQPDFEAHVQAHPDGEFIYVYVPKITEHCTYGDEHDSWTYGNEWYIAHVDIDLLFDDVEPSIAYAVIGAANGTVTDAGVEYPMEWRVLVDETFSFTGDMLPTLGLLEPVTRSASFDVPEGAMYFWVEVGTASGASLRLLDPDGNVAEEGTDRVYYWADEAAAGAWTVELTRHTMRPNEPFSVDVFAEAGFYIED